MFSTVKVTVFFHQFGFGVSFTHLLLFFELEIKNFLLLCLHLVLCILEAQQMPLEYQRRLARQESCDLPLQLTKSRILLRRLVVM